jgi:hypothetical protein
MDAKATKAEMEPGAKALAAAETAEQANNMDEAAAQYEVARDAFRQSAQAANDRAMAAQADLTTQLTNAKSAATTARDALTDDLRLHAPKESLAAEAAWESAAKAEADKDIEGAVKNYKTAQSKFEEARVSAGKNMDTARARLTEAKTSAETERGKITAEAHVVAPKDVEAGDTAYADAQAREQAGEVDLARKQYENAGNSYLRASQAVVQKNREMNASQERDAQAKADEEAKKAADDKARQTMATRKAEADRARAAADTALVKELAATELNIAASAYSDAQKAEQGKKYDQAASFYATARAGFANAAAQATEREKAQQAKQSEMQAAQTAMNTAKGAAQSERTAANTAQTRENAATELQQADQAWASAESAENAADYSGAADLYAKARTAYANARTTAQTRMQQATPEPEPDAKERTPLYLRKRGTR